MLDELQLNLTSLLEVSPNRIHRWLDLFEETYTKRDATLSGSVLTVGAAQNVKKECFEASAQTRVRSKHFDTGFDDPFTGHVRVWIHWVRFTLRLTALNHHKSGLLDAAE